MNYVSKYFPVQLSIYPVWNENGLFEEFTFLNRWSLFPVLACWLKSSETPLYEAELWRKPGSGDIQALSCLGACRRWLSVINPAAMQAENIRQPTNRLFRWSAWKWERHFAEEVRARTLFASDDQTCRDVTFWAQNTTEWWISQARPLASMVKWVTTSHARSLLAAAHGWRKM